MATTAAVNFDVNHLRTRVIAIHDRVAPEPHAHVHRGPECARDLLGYDREELAGHGPNGQGVARRAVVSPSESAGICYG